MKRTFIGVVVGVIFVFVIYNFYTTFSLENDYSFGSSVYRINSGYITNISPYTDVSLFTSYFDVSNCSVVVRDSNNRDIVDGYVFNGSKTVVKSDHQVVATYTNIIKGDVTGDGKVQEDDFSLFGKYLIYRDTIQEDISSSFDIDGIDGIHLNDLMILEHTIASGYQSMTLSHESLLLQSGESKRVVASVVPNYGLDGNVRWVSNDENVAVVSRSGVITGKNVGSTIVKATTVDGKISKEVVVKVDNTIQLGSYSGNVYQDGNELSVFIKSIDYNNITCSSSDTSVVSCRIDGKYLYLSAGNSGGAYITVTSSLYGSQRFEAVSVKTGISLAFGNYKCLIPGQSDGLIISTFNAGTLSFDISDKDIIESAYVSGRNFLVKAGKKTGRGQVVIKGSNTNISKTFTMDVYQLYFPSVGGYGAIGEEIIGEMVANNVGTLSCDSPDESSVTCRVEGNRLYVVGTKVGQYTIRVQNSMEYNGQNYSCGYAEFLVVVQGE